MEFTEKTYPVDRAIFDRILLKRGLTKAEAGKRIGYGKSAIGQAVFEGRFSLRMAVGLHDAYGITPNDYAPKIPGVNAPDNKRKTPEIGVMQFDSSGREIRLDGTPKPKAAANPVDEALLADGVYTLEFVDVRPARRTGDTAEGYRFVSIATGNGARQPYYFGLYNRDPGGRTVNAVGEEWISHLLRVALGADYRESSEVTDIVGRKVKAYVMIYDKAGKRYNRTVWVEPITAAEAVKAVTWQDTLNTDTDTDADTLRDALEYIVGELSLRRHGS